MGLEGITTLDDYLTTHGRILGQKAMAALKPLHTPGVDELPHMEGFMRTPFDAQAHVIAAATKMMTEASNGFVVGECGTGKTIIGMCAVHLHAKGKPYRAMVLCPDHLISKWVREIETTIPDAKVFRFENWKRILDLADKGRRVKKTIAGPDRACASIECEVDDSDIEYQEGEDGVTRAVVIQKTKTVTTFVGAGSESTTTRATWEQPLTAEWYVIGRNQAKWMPNWIGVGESHRGFNGEPAEKRSSHAIIVSKEPKKDDLGKEVKDASGKRVMVPVIDRTFHCPVCGHVSRNKDGTAVSATELAKKQTSCEGYYLQEVPDPEATGESAPHNYERIYSVTESYTDHRGVRRAGKSVPVAVKWKDTKPGRVVKCGKKHYLVKSCGEPLWNWVSKPYRWSPARVIHKKMRGSFKYLLIDEVHEMKSDESAQSMSAGKLMSAAKHTVALTGTLIGGYANHMFPLMIRMTPDTLRDEGFEWGKDMPFSQAYGRVDRIVTTKLGEDAGTTVGKNQSSMRRARNGGRATQREAVRPGVMPTLFGRHMIGSSLFITLEEMAGELPGLHEYVGGPLRDQAPGEDLEDYEHYKKLWVDCACDMDDEVREEYERIEEILEAANRELLKKGSMKLLGSTLYTLLDYPDRPYGWTPDFDGELAVGYYNLPKNYTQQNWVGVVQPADLDPEVIRPKEKALVQICKLNKSVGNQCWVYCQMTGKRDVMKRLKVLLETEGLRVGILRADTVNPKEREEWIATNGGNFDVVLSHPKLVSTGLDLFATSHGNHNFNTIVFYETGYNLFDMRQAARRSWRIGQPKECQVYYLYYKGRIVHKGDQKYLGSMQHRAMDLMSRKMAAATALEGEFSTEGLVAMAGEDNAQMAMARTLSGKIDDGDIQRNWGKVSSGGKKKLKRSALIEPDVIDVLFEGSSIPRPGDPSPFDDLPMAAQMVAETIMDHQDDGCILDDDDEIIASLMSYQPKAPMKLVGPGAKPKAASPMSRDEVAKLMADLADFDIDLEDLL